MPAQLASQFGVTMCHHSGVCRFYSGATKRLDMSSDTFYADGYFVELCSEILNQEIERYHSVPKEGVVALLVDHSKFSTYVNNKQSLLPNSRTGLKKGNIIGISY